MSRRGALALAAAVVVVLAAGVVVATRPDPYRPGTVHRVEVYVATGCAPEIRLGDQAWVPGRGRGSRVLGTRGGWIEGVETTTGMLEIVDRDDALFRPDGSALSPIPFRSDGEPGCRVPT